MENEFSKVMSVQSDKELIKITRLERHKYQTLALEAAESELEKRHLQHDGFMETVKAEEEKIIDKYLVDFDIVNSYIRGFNFYIDLTLWIIISSIVEAFFMLLIPERNDIISLIIYSSIFLGYYGFMEFKYQKTLAKYITKTKVVTYNGLKPDKEKILIRTLSRLIPIDLISYYVSEVGIHDRLSKTRVIKDNPNNVIEDNIKF